MLVQPFSQLTPASTSAETLSINGKLQLLHNTVSPRPIFFISCRCSLKDLAVVLFIVEKSILLIVTTI